MISRKLSRVHRILVSGEVFLVFTVSIVVSILRLEENLFEVLLTFPGQPKILILPLIWYFFLYVNDGWDRSKLLNSNKFFSDVFDSALKSLVVFSATSYLINYPISRVWVIANIGAITTSILIFRLTLRKYMLKPGINFSELKYLYIGDKNKLESFAAEFSSLFGFKPRFTCFNPPGRESAAIWLKNYKENLKDDFFGVVISYASINDPQLLKELSNFKRNVVIDIILESRIAPIVKRFEMLENPTLIKIRQSTLVVSGAFLKRLVDIIGAILGLILLSPVFLITAIAVKVSSSGPVLFTDRRVGKNSVVFTFPKFRSMAKGSEFKRQDFIGKPDEEILLRYKNDPRITKIGRFIRRWSIDELPQLWCVLIGTMSLVGPRPILVEEVELVDPLHTERFIAKPGLTGLWQITGRKEVAWEDRMLRDLAYVENWSLSRDLVYILKTFRAIIRGEGAF